MARVTDSSESTATSRLLTLLAITLALLAMYFASEILLPVALAVLFSFLLAPFSRFLERRLRIGRIAAVASTVLLTTMIVGGIGWLLFGQAMELGRKMPGYREDLVARFRSLRESASEGGISETTETIEDIGEELTGTKEKPPPRRETDSKSKDESAHAPPADGAADEAPPVEAEANATPPAPPAPEKSASAQDDAEQAATGESITDPLSVRVVEMPPSPLESLQASYGPVVAPLSTAGIVFVLVIFILIKREDLRNRFISLLGSAHLSVTTEAIDDAARRVSRFLQVQVIINTSFGLCVGSSLYLIGVPNAIMWGILAGLLRFLPYLGPWIAATVPILVSMAETDGWLQPLGVFGTFLVLELIINNGVEPWLYGSRIGVSSVGLIVAVIFWTWLWGLVGLMVAVPLTVCLAVMGRYVPHLRFLNVLLSDDPALPPEMLLYQRMLAMDLDEAERVIEQAAKERSFPAVCDEVLIPALHLAERDRHAGVINGQRRRFIEQSMQDLVDAALEHCIEAPPAGKAKEGRMAKVLIVPAGDAADVAAAHMLAACLPANSVEIATNELLAGELVERLERKDVGVVVISSVPPLASRSARYLCKRIRRRISDLPILVGLWNDERDYERTRARLTAAGASRVVTTIQEAAARTHEAALRSALQQAAEQPRPAAGEGAEPAGSLSIATN